MSGTDNRTFRMVRYFGTGADPARPYRVETEDLLSEREAMALLRELGSPYNGRLLDDKPSARPVKLAAAPSDLKELTPEQVEFARAATRRALDVLLGVKRCSCGRPVNKHGKTCCQMCWIGYGSGSHSILCNRRNA